MDTPQTQPTAKLEVKNLNFYYGNFHAIRDVNMTIREHKVTAFIGPSGCGKSTLLRIIAGLVEPDRGMLAIGERLVWRDGTILPAEKRRVGMVFQDYALWPHMSIAGNLAFGLNAQRLPAREVDARVGHALEVTRLAPFRDRYPSELSGGQQQRVAIARCLAARPALMLFDEPLSNLDAALREDMRVEMMELVRREAITVIYVTHDQSEAMAVSDRIAVMRAGVIAQLDTPRAIYEAPADSFVAGFIGGFSVVRGEVCGGLFRVGEADAGLIPAPGARCGAGMLVVRPEDARPAGDDPNNHVRGRVVASAFQGRCWRLVVELGPQRVRLDWPECAPVGAMLAFSLPPERCLVLTS
jgi:ABC-type Fe3+/spermidine/putrescine transport system ATPase subunit